MNYKTTEEEVDDKLRQLALTDWNKFKEVTALDVTTFTICEQKRAGKSYRQIAYKMGIHFTTVRDRCKKCMD